MALVQVRWRQHTPQSLLQIQEALHLITEYLHRVNWSYVTYLRFDDTPRRCLIYKAMTMV
jgi:hypothetical protein